MHCSPRVLYDCQWLFEYRIMFMIEFNIVLLRTAHDWWHAPVTERCGVVSGSWFCAAGSARPSEQFDSVWSCTAGVLNDWVCEMSNAFVEFWVQDYLPPRHHTEITEMNCVFLYACSRYQSSSASSIVSGLTHPEFVAHVEYLSCQALLVQTAIAQWTDFNATVDSIGASALNFWWGTALNIVLS